MDFDIGISYREDVPIKLLFLNGKDEYVIQNSIEKIFDVLSEHANNFPQDDILHQAKLINNPREIHLLFDEKKLKFGK